MRRILTLDDIPSQGKKGSSRKKPTNAGLEILLDAPHWTHFSRRISRKCPSHSLAQFS